MERIIQKYRNEIVHSVEECNVLLLSGYPDSYMYSFVPFYLYRAGFTDRAMPVTNPPKICTVFTNKTDAVYFADLCSALVSDDSKVAHVFDENAKYNKNADVVYTTDEHLMNKMLTDPLLSEYSVFVLCGLHERKLNMEVLLALMKRLFKVRSRLRLVLLYESTNVTTLFNYFKKEGPQGDRDVTNVDFNPALAVLKDVHYIHLENEFSFYRVNYLSKPTSNYMESLMSTVCELCKDETPGNILTFVPTRDHAQILKAELEDLATQFPATKGKTKVVCLRGDLYMDDKENVLRYIFICTEVTDYNFGVGQVTYLVDSCLTRRLSSDYLNTGMSETVTASSREEMAIKASLIQDVRKGRCYRMLTQEDYNTIIQDAVTPEIVTGDLTKVLLVLKAIGIQKLNDFDFIVKPPRESLQHSLTLLYLLKAIDNRGELVYPVGNLMAELKGTPFTASFLYKSVEAGCSEEALIIYAMLQVKDMLWKKSAKSYRKDESFANERLESAKLAFAALEGDLISYFNLFQLAQYYKEEDDKWLGAHMVNEGAIELAVRIKNKTAALLNKYHLTTVGARNAQASCDGNVETLIMTIFSSFFLNVACKEHLVQNFQNSRQLVDFLAANKPIHEPSLKKEERQPYVLVKSFLKFDYKPMYIHPASFIANEQPDWVVFNQSNQIDGKVFMHDVTTIKPEYLQQLAPYFFGEADIQPYLTNF